MAVHPFHALYRGHYGFVWHTVRRFGVQPPHADDAVQETFVVAYRRLDELSMPTAKAWLYGIARRVASNYRRADHRSARKRAALAASTRTRSPATPPTDVKITFERFLAGLSAVDRELFVLSEIEGMSGPEAAEILGLNVSTTYGRLQVVRRRFRDAVAEPEQARAIEEACASRPVATNRGWALLVPHLQAVSATKVLPWLSGAALAKVAVLAVPLALLVGVVVVRPSGSVLPGKSVVAAPAPVPGAARDVAAAREPVPRDPEPAREPEVAPEPVADPEVTPRRAVVPSRSPDPAPTPTEDPTLDAENRLLAESSEALRRGASEQALASLKAHAEQFPDSGLADARAALRIDALCALGKDAQARGEARLFAIRHPRSPVLARVRRSCAAASVDPPDSGQATDR